MCEVQCHGISNPTSSACWIIREWQMMGATCDMRCYMRKKGSTWDSKWGKWVVHESCYMRHTDATSWQNVAGGDIPVWRLCYLQTFLWVAPLWVCVLAVWASRMINTLMKSAPDRPTEAPGPGCSLWRTEWGQCRRCCPGRRGERLAAGPATAGNIPVNIGTSWCVSRDVPART